MLFLKIAAILLLSIPLIVVIPIFLPKLRKNKVIRGIWLVCIAFFGFFMLLFGFIFLNLLLLFSPGAGAHNDLVSLSKDLKYKGTRFEYRYGETDRVMYDPYDNFRWIYGNKPDEIFVDKGTRVVVYNNAGAIIKSKKDDIEVRNDEVHTMGWMGAYTDATRFKADKDGFIHITQD